MSTRVFDRGRQIYASADWRPPKPGVRYLDREGKPIDQRPVPKDAPDSPFRVGVPYRDRDDGLVYRVVQRLDLSEGWGTADFWMQRFQVSWDTICDWVRRGFLDAAIEQGSPTKRYRCRDESKILAYLEIDPMLLGKKPSTPGPKARSGSKRSRPAR